MRAACSGYVVGCTSYLYVYVVAAEAGGAAARAGTGSFGRGADYDGRFSSRPGGRYRDSGPPGGAGRGGFDRF